ncbi:MAG: endolytic transglycosylase MltG [Flavobacteriales bacterium]|nr:endolytic transglycosylase MltG [Flavobacteriales bacterium]
MAAVKKKGGLPQWKKVLMIFLALVVLGGSWAGYEFYATVFSPNVVMEAEEGYFHVPTGSGFKEVADLLQRKGIITNRASFEWLAKQLHYPENIRAGRYLLRTGMNNKDLILLLRSGRQIPVKVVINNIRLKEELAGRVGNLLEADSVEMMRLMSDPLFTLRYGFEPEAFSTLFLPNTYEFYWNTSAEEFVDKLAKEYKKFWTAERMAKAKKLGLEQSEVSILASIVEKESNFRSEHSTVAGVYLNRLRIGMPLQADPTLVFANRDFGAKRILNRHKEIDSPYNTYRYKGLPPGPICIPDPRTIDAVLDAEKHSYIYFCAQADGAGRHAFAATYNEHLRNAQAFQRMLNKQGVMR